MTPVALVTGANRGIGLEVCRQLAKAGCATILSARDGAKAEAAARALANDGLDVAAQVLDVTSEASIQAAVAAVIARFGRIDVLVNNAAVLADESNVLRTSVNDFQRTFQTNVLGAITTAHIIVPAMAKRRYGRVVNVSSTAGQCGHVSGFAPAYSISKVALNAYTRQLASAVAGTGVLVNAACPGWVRTEMGGRSAPRSTEQGADTIVWLATLPDNGPSGGFFSDRRQIDW
jgi:NAD(P)-dependent dehydrogenase (short-subunit alcohol dehydrogenase family)